MFILEIYFNIKKYLINFFFYFKYYDIKNYCMIFNKIILTLFTNYLNFKNFIFFKKSFFFIIYKLLSVGVKSNSNDNTLLLVNRNNKLI